MTSMRAFVPTYSLVMSFTASAAHCRTPNVPARRLGEFRPIGVTEPRKDTFIFDLGQNMVGWARLRARGAAGTAVTLRFAEMLNPDGTIEEAKMAPASPDVDFSYDFQDLLLKPVKK